MTATLRVPTALRRITDGADRIPVSSATLREALETLEQRYPGIKARVLDAVTGNIHPYVSIFINDNDVQYMHGLDTPIMDGDEIVIVPAIAGGAANG